MKIMNYNTLVWGSTVSIVPPAFSLTKENVGQ